MKPGVRFVFWMVEYTIELVGPRTSLLVRADGAFVHADTAALRAFLEGV